MSLNTENTRAAYYRDARHFLAFCAEHDIDVMNARRVDIDAYVRTLEHEERTAATIARRLSSLHSFYTYAEGEDLIGRNPLSLVKRPKVSDHSQTFGPDKAEVNVLRKAAKAAGPRDHALILLLTVHGLRVSEAIALDAEHLTDERGYRVAKIEGKGGRIDRVPLDASVVDALTDLNIETGPLLTDPNGERLNRHQVTRIVKRLAKAAGIDGKVSPHSLRHSSVTLALDADVPLHIVQDHARHADPRTTRRYDQGRGQLENQARAQPYRVDADPLRGQDSVDRDPNSTTACEARNQHMANQQGHSYLSAERLDCRERTNRC